MNTENSNLKVGQTLFNGYTCERYAYGNSEFNALVRLLPSRVMDLFSRAERNLGSIGLRVKMVRQNPVAHFENAGAFAANFMADCMELLTVKTGLNTATGEYQHLERNLFLSNNRKNLLMLTTLLDQTSVGRPSLSISIYTYLDDLIAQGYEEEALQQMTSDSDVFSVRIHSTGTDAGGDYHAVPCLLKSNSDLKKVYVNRITGAGKLEEQLPKVVEITTSYKKVMEFLLAGGYDATSETQIPAQFAYFRDRVSDALVADGDTVVKTKLWDDIESAAGGFLFYTRPISSRAECSATSGMANWVDFSAEVLRQDSYDRPLWIPMSTNMTEEGGAGPAVNIVKIEEAGASPYKGTMCVFENREIFTERWGSGKLYEDRATHTFENYFAAYANRLTSTQMYVDFEPNEGIINCPDGSNSNAILGRRLQQSEAQFLDFFVLGDTVQLNKPAGSTEKLQQIAQKVEVIQSAIASEDDFHNLLKRALKYKDNDSGESAEGENDIERLPLLDAMNKSIQNLAKASVEKPLDIGASTQIGKSNSKELIEPKDLSLLLLSVLVNKLVS